MAEAVLLSGDEDVRVGVQQAQELGVRVHLVGIKPARGSQSTLLLQEADATYEWTQEDLRPFLAVDAAADEGRTSEALAGSSETAPARPARGGDESELLERVAREGASEIRVEELESLVADIEATGQRPSRIDGQLLAKGRAAIRRDLTSNEKSEVRSAFLRTIKARLEAGS